MQETLEQIASEIRTASRSEQYGLELAKFADIRSDYEILRMLADTISEKSSIAGFEYKQWIESLPKTMEFLKYVEMLTKKRYKEFSEMANAKFIAFSGMLAKLCTENKKVENFCDKVKSDAGVASNISFSIDNLMGIANVGYGAMLGKLSPHQIEVYNEKLLILIKLIFEVTPPEDDFYDGVIAEYKGRSVEFFEILQSLEPAVRAELLGSLREFLRCTIACAVMRRAPVIIIRDSLCFCKFVGVIKLKPLYEYFGLTIGQIVPSIAQGVAHKETIFH